MSTRPSDNVTYLARVIFLKIYLWVCEGVQYRMYLEVLLKSFLTYYHSSNLLEYKPRGLNRNLEDHETAGRESIFWLICNLNARM